MDDTLVLQSRSVNRGILPAGDDTPITGLGESEAMNGIPRGVGQAIVQFLAGSIRGDLNFLGQILDGLA